MIKELTIRNEFYGAGSPKQYNWIKDSFDIKGIGIRRDYLDLDYLIINLHNNKYVLDCAVASEFAERYNSYFKAKGDTQLVIISVSLLISV